MMEHTQRKTRNLGAALALALVTGTLFVAAPSATAFACLPGFDSDGDCESLFQNLNAGPPQCEPLGTPTTWIVHAGFQSGGPLDKVIGRVVCVGDHDGDGIADEDTVAACIADFFQRDCSSAGTSLTGGLRCKLEKVEAMDVFTIEGAYVECYDPADPLHVLPVVFDTVNDAT